MDEKFVMYLFVNGDLQMKKGKTASQTGHVVNLITEKIMTDMYEMSPSPKHVLSYLKWKKTPTMIVLKASEKELREMMKMDNSVHFIDMGSTTQVPENSLTCVGFLPSSDKKLDEFASKFKLLN